MKKLLLNLKIYFAFVNYSQTEEVMLEVCNPRAICWPPPPQTQKCRPSGWLGEPCISSSPQGRRSHVFIAILKDAFPKLWSLVHSKILFPQEQISLILYDLCGTQRHVLIITIWKVILQVHTMSNNSWDLEAIMIKSKIKWAE